MEILRGREERAALDWIIKAAQTALDATCQRAKCGSVIVADDLVIGRGYNSPPNNDESQRTCSVPKAFYDPKVTDKTCCIHAEIRAINDALRKNPEILPGSRLYFMRIDEGGNPAISGEPYCTICSKQTLEVGISEFVLWKKEGICVYDTNEYHEISRNYQGTPGHNYSITPEEAKDIIKLSCLNLL